MTASPQFIAIKKGKEWSTVSSWRESPSMRPVDASAGKTPPLSPQPGPAATTTTAPGGSASGGRGRRGKAAGGAGEEAFEDFMIKAALGATLRGEAERTLIAQGLRPLRCIVVSPVRAACLMAPPTHQAGKPSGTVAAATAVPEDAFASPQVGGKSPEEDGGAPPELELPPSIPTNALMVDEVHFFFMSSQEDASKGAKLLMAAHSSVAADVYVQRRSLVNSTLVIKNLPHNIRCERLIELIESLPRPPSYVRLHRSERGVFKSVVFVKYPSRAVAETSKLELERVMVGTRPLRVEFKKKTRTAGDAGAATAAATAATTASGSTAEGGGGSAGGGAKDAGQSIANLEKAVRDLRHSNDYEGFFYPRAALTKDEIKYLKQLCTNFDLLLDNTTENVTVKRKPLVANKTPSDTSGASSKVSPAMKPQTPPWTPATPGSLHPLEFRGIRHWKEMRQRAGVAAPVSGDPSGLPIHRPLGVSDVPAFGAGRGRPITAGAS